MTNDLEARIAELRQRRRIGQEDAEVELDRLKAVLSEHADGIRAELDAEGKRIKLLMSSVGVQACVAAETMTWLREDNEAMRENLKANGALLRRQARWAWIVLGAACLAAVVILLLAGWAGVSLNSLLRFPERLSQLAGGRP